MHFRNRSPGNGYRAHSMGMGGVATASRVSPESSMRGHGGYGNQFRNYSRGGFGRGNSRQFSHPQVPAPALPQPRGSDSGGDILMKAGKLAAEYLIARGFLPANALSGKWQNGTLKTVVGGREGKGRASALSQLGEAVSDSGPSRRRYGDDCSNSVGSRSLGRRKRNGSFTNQEMGRSGSWTERSRAASAEGGDTDDSDRVSQSSASNAIGGRERDVAGDPRSSSDRLKTGGNANAGVKDGSSPSKEDSGKEAVEKDDEKVHLNGEKKDDIAIIASSDEGSLSFCRFVKIPTRTRSSMADRGSRTDTDHKIVDESAQKGEDLAASNLSTYGSPNRMNDSEVVGLDRLGVSSSEDELVEGSSTAPASSPGRSLVKDPDFEMIAVMTMEHGAKRALDEDDASVGNKRPRESGPSEDVEPGPVIKMPIIEELMTSEDLPNMISSDEKRLLDDSLYPKIEIEPVMEYMEEKQLLPGSFKTCDLNLMEAAESNDTHDLDPMSYFHLRS